MIGRLPPRLLATITFLVGFMTGVAVLLLVPGLSGRSGNPPSSTSTPGPGAPSAGAVPSASDGRPAVRPCLDLAGEVPSVTRVLADAATAARDVDAARLADAVRRMGRLNGTLDDRARACRAAAGAPDGSPTGPPSATTSPAGTG